MLCNGSHMLHYGESERQPEVKYLYFDFEKLKIWAEDCLGSCNSRAPLRVRTEQNLPQSSGGWDAGTEPWCSKQKSICSNNEIVVPTMPCTTVLQNCNYLVVQGQVPQSDAQLSKLPITITQRTDTGKLLYTFSSLTGHHPDSLTSAPNRPSCCFPVVYLLMKIKMSNLGIINIYRSPIFSLTEF